MAILEGDSPKGVKPKGVMRHLYSTKPSDMSFIRSAELS